MDTFHAQRTTPGGTFRYNAGAAIFESATPPRNGSTGILPEAAVADGGHVDPTARDGGKLNSPDADAHAHALNGERSQEATACRRCQETQLRESRYRREIGEVRSAWSQARQDRMRAWLEVDQRQAILDAYDAWFHNASLGKDEALPVKTLSTLAEEYMDRHFQDAGKHKLQEMQRSIDERRSKVRKSARTLLSANRTFCNFGLAYRDEMDRYMQWLEAKRLDLHENYRRYCQIMRENGAEPELMYGDSPTVLNCQNSFLDAWASRQEAARAAVEAAHLDGCADIMEDMLDL